MAKRYICLLMATIIIVCSFTACTSTEIVNQEDITTTTETTTILTDDDNFQLSYTKADSLNPYESQTLNNQTLSTLVYDSLFKLDDSFKAETQIANDFEYTESKKLKVTINSDIAFSNGSVLTAGDVVYSFEMAKDSPAYKNSLLGISSASKSDEYTVVFTLNYDNPYAQNLLTFPICEYGSAEGKSYPLGSGKYYYKDVSNNEIVLKVNKNKKDFNPHFTTIHLVNIASAESIDNALTISDIDFAYRDLSSNISKNLNTQKKLFSLNNLVYIGLNNKKSSIMSNVNIRQAVSLAIDRTALAKSAYQGFATAATSVFNPSSELSSNSEVFSSESDLTGAKQAIAKSGYKSSQLKISILVNNDNENRTTAASLIKTSLENAGFKVTINKVTAKAYKKAIKKKSFDIYIGETRIPDDMNFYSFFSSSGATRYGINQKSDCITSYKDYLSGKTNLGKCILDFNNDMPFVPVLYRQGMIAYSKSMHGDMQGGYENCFSNIEEWYFNS